MATITNTAATMAVNKAEINTPIYSDVDGVVLNFSAGFYAFMAAEFGVLATEPEPMNFDYSDVFRDIDMPAKHIKKFICESEFFASLPPYADSFDAISLLSSAGVVVNFITSIKCSSHSEAARTNNLNKLFLAPQKITCLDLSACKSDALRSLPPGVFVDDQPSVCERVAELNLHKVFLMDRRYNQRHLPESVTRIKSLFELPHFIQL